MAPKKPPGQPPAKPAAKAPAAKSAAKAPAAKPPAAKAKPPAAKPAAAKAPKAPKEPRPFSVESLSKGVKKGGAPTGGGPRPAPRAPVTGKLDKAGTAARGLAGAGGTSKIERGTTPLRTVRGLGSRFMSAARAGGRSLLRRPKMGGTIGAAVGLGLAGYDAYRAFQDSGDKPAPKPSATPKVGSAPKPPAKSAKPPAKAPAAKRTPSPRPTPFKNSPEYQKQSEFLAKLQNTPYKRTADEQKAYDSIMRARANPGSGLVGAKIVGRKKPKGMK